MISAPLVAMMQAQFEATESPEGISRILEQLTNTMRYALGVSLVNEGLKGNVTAIKELADRTAGKPHQSLDHTTDGEKMNPVHIYIPDNGRNKIISHL